MRINILLTLLALVVSGMVFYGLYEINREELIFPIVATVVNVLLLVFTMGISMGEYPRSTVMAKTLTGVLWLVALVMNILFTMYAVSNAVLIISNVVLVCIWMACVYGISRVKQ